MKDATLRQFLNIAFLLIAVTSAASAQQIIPARNETADAVVTEDLRLVNRSPFDAAMVSILYDVIDHTPAVPAPIRLEPGESLIVPNIVERLFGLTTDTRGAVVMTAPESVTLERRIISDHIAGEWHSSVPLHAPVTNAESSSLGRRRGGRRPVPEPSTRVRGGDVASFAGSYGVSGIATIVEKNVIRLTGFRHNGTAPGIDLRIGLSANSRRNFTVLQSPGRQVFSNATLDIVLPPNLDLNSFDTFTVWCFEFNVIIAEGRFRTP